MDDLLLEQKIIDLQNTVREWSIKKKVWNQSSFKAYFDHVEEEPNEYEACVTILCPDGDLSYIADGDFGDLSEEFEELIDSTEFWFEREHGNLLFYATEDDLNKLYLDYFEWQWIARLIQDDYTSLHNEVYEYFIKRPEKLYSLSSRKFEIFISELFRNQGYHTELGPGTNDGGIDVKIFQKDAIDQIVTLVQVKRYKADLPVKFEAVASFHQIVEEEKANRGLFITTSKFVPQAKRFAARQKNRLTLANTVDVVKWCEEVKTRIVRDKSQAISDDYILSILKRQNVDSNIGKIVVANHGYNCTMNDFCIVLLESSNAAILMRLPQQNTNTLDPPYNTRGYKVPVLDKTVLEKKNKENVFRAKKTVDDGRISFWGQLRLFFVWNGTPQYFDYND